LHFERFFTPCSHGPKCFGAIFRFVPLVVNSSLRFSSTSAPSISGTAILTRGRHTVVVIPPSRPVKCDRTKIHFSNESVKPLFTFFVLVLPPTSQSFACSAERGCENMAALLRAAGNGMARRARDTASSFAVASQQVSARAPEI
jgi:hypothetical protein